MDAAVNIQSVFVNGIAGSPSLERVFNALRAAQHLLVLFEQEAVRPFRFCPPLLFSLKLKLLFGKQDRQSFLAVHCQHASIR